MHANLIWTIFSVELKCEITVTCGLITDLQHRNDKKLRGTRFNVNAFSLELVSTAICAKSFADFLLCFGEKCTQATTWTNTPRLATNELAGQNPLLALQAIEFVVLILNIFISSRRHTEHFHTLRINTTLESDGYS